MPTAPPVVGWRLHLDENLADHLTWLDAREAEVEALAAERQSLVVEAKAVQQRGVNVLHVNGALDWMKAEVVGCAE